MTTSHTNPLRKISKHHSKIQSAESVLYCIDKAHLHLLGSFNAPKGNSSIISFVTKGYRYYVHIQPTWPCRAVNEHEYIPSPSSGRKEYTFSDRGGGEEENDDGAC